MKSIFLRLGLNDIIKGAIMAALTAIVAVLVPVLESGAFPTFEVIKGALLSGLSVGAVYLLKNFLTNSKDKFLTKE